MILLEFLQYQWPFLRVALVLWLVSLLFFRSARGSWWFFKRRKTETDSEYKRDSRVLKWVGVALVALGLGIVVLGLLV
jgi:hypothetical protein